MPKKQKKPYKLPPELIETWIDNKMEFIKVNGKAYVLADDVLKKIEEVTKKFIK